MQQRLFDADLTAEERQLSPLEFKQRKPELRQRTKALLLGLLYGLTASGLAKRLKVTLTEATLHLDRLFRLFNAAHDGGELSIRHAQNRGYAVNVSGFKRFISGAGRQQENALRNHPVQSGAMALFKLALLKVDRRYRDTDVKILLPRHDSILIECAEHDRDETIAVIKALMIEAVKGIFPTLRPRVEAKYGPSWPTEKTLAGKLRVAHERFRPSATIPVLATTHG